MTSRFMHPLRPALVAGALAAGGGAPLPAAVTLSLSPSPDVVTPGTALRLQVYCAGAPPGARVFMTVYQMPVPGSFTAPTVIFSGFGPRFCFIAPMVHQETIYQISCMYQDACVTRAIKVRPAGAGAPAGAPPAAGAGAGTSKRGRFESPEAVPDARVKPGEDVPDAAVKRGLDTLPSAIFKHIHSFDALSTSAGVSRTFRQLAFHTTTHLTLTRPVPGADLVGRVLACPRLTSLRLRSFEGVPRDVVMATLVASGNLTHLEMDHTIQLLPEDFRAIGRANPRLASLSVQGLPLPAEALAAAFPNLRSLALETCMPQDFSSMARLESLNVRGTRPGGTPFQAGHLPPSLRTLKVEYGDLDAGALPAGLASLELT